MKRLFIAVNLKLSPEFQKLVTQIKRETYCDSVTWVNEVITHLTLRFLGKTPEPLIPQIENVLKEVTSNFNSFSLEMNKLGVFGSKYAPDVIWLGFTQFEEFLNLFQRLEEKLNLIGVDANYGNFVPHVTLGRIKKIENKNRFWTMVNRLSPTVSQTIAVDELHLIQSHLTSQGPIYKVLKSFPLN